MNSEGKPVAVVIGATSKWQSDGRNTKLAHGSSIDDSDLPVGARWGVGGAIAHKFASQGYQVVLTTRNRSNATALEESIVGAGGQARTVELDLSSETSIQTAFAAIREQVGYRQLDADCSKPALRKNRDDVSVDLSAFAKGYAVDEAAEMLITAGQASFLVEVGGELRMQGTNAAGEPWAIAVERPNVGERSVESVLHLTNTALATSGDYRNFYEFDGKRFSHTIDPRTARPVTHDGASVTVVAESAANADALATALLVMGPVDGLEFAAANDIAAFFLLRTDRGFEQRATGSFAKQVRK